ncbi:Transcription factor bHLH47-like protein [Drosera capensis]
MSSDATDPRMDNDNDSAEDEMDGSCANKNKRRKAPRRTLKAEREKLKREQLNELFSKLVELTYSLYAELNEETNGKACILREAIKFVNDVLSDIQTLRKGNAALLSEFQYLTAEKNELRDENCTLETQIKNIQNDIDERVSHSYPDVNLIPAEGWEPGTISNIPESSPSFQSVDLMLHHSPFLGPMYMIAASNDLQVHPIAAKAADPPSIVSKPHASPRFPGPLLLVGHHRSNCDDNAYRYQISNPRLPPCPGRIQKPNESNDAKIRRIE